MEETKQLTVKDYETVARPDWCLGCGDFGIQVAVKQALCNLQIAPHMVTFVCGIGCSGKMTHWVNSYGLHALHGRAVPPAVAVKFANPKLTVIAEGGDGDGYGIGLGHFIHTARRNVDITYMVHNNMVYGLTKGQAAPTSMKGYKSPSTPFGVIEEPINPIALALTAGATFVARASAGDAIHLTKIIEEAIKHKGFSLIDIFQPCVTFNKIQTYAFFVKNTYKLESDPAYDNTNFDMAMQKAFQADKLPIGIFYKQSRPTYEDEDPGFAMGNASEADISNIDITKVMAKYC